ncbi:hypothetical protein [Exiguobacterium sp. AM39-5BH]|uniref:hypothetical protein n=1 Tax=Exiguobacterium sp. AM39-5BH TaxID=2292355 RepID=UPI000FE24CFE|nr:hypothetical protein [Exiguobacterium sp. AM39-5BH]
MTTITRDDRERLTKDLEDSLMYFANRQHKSISRQEATDISRNVMAGVNINDSVFAHKGPSWLAREIISARK